MIDMINTRQVVAELDALADKVKQTDEKAAQRLANLRVAVNGSSNTSAWAASDIHELIEPDLVVERFKKQRTTNAILIICEGLRNIFIFVPLVVTWWGISAAVSSYSDLIKTNASDIQLPFLFLWQRGFDGRLQWWQTLGTLAFIDFGLLAFVVTLSFIIFIANDIVRKNRERQGEELRSELLHTLAAASLCLARSARQQQPTSIVSDFNQSMTRFDDMIQQLLTRLKDIGDRQGQQQQLFDNFKRDLVTIMTTVSRAVTELRTSNTDLKNSMEALVKPAHDIAAQLDPLGANIQKAVDRLQQQINTQQSILQEQQQLSTSLRSSLTNLTQAAQSVQNMARDITKFTDDQKQLVDKQNELVDKQKEISANTVSYTQLSVTITEKMKELSIEMAQLVKYMNDVAFNLTRFGISPQPFAPSPGQTPMPPFGGAASPNPQQPYASPAGAGAASPNPQQQQPYASPAGAGAASQVPPYQQQYAPPPSPTGAGASSPVPPHQQQYAPSPVRNPSPMPPSPSTPKPPPPGF